MSMRRAFLAAFEGEADIDRARGAAGTMGVGAVERSWEPRPP
jgi:hypothetical protein